jgi:putative MATE family efflux protein
MPDPSPSFRVHDRSGTIREVAVLAAPLVIANLSQSFMWVVDTFLMGRVGTVEQGAVGLGGVLWWSMLCLFTGTMTVTGILVAQDFGAERQDIARNVRAGLVLVVPMTLLVLLARGIVPAGLRAMHVTDAVRPLAETYIHVRVLATPLVLTSFVLTSYLRGIGNTVTPMVVSLTANVINALLAVVLVFGLGGMEPMGVKGAAVATVLASLAECLLYVGVYWFGRGSRAHGSRRWRLPSRDLLRRFLTMGVPIGLAWLFEAVAWTAFSVYSGTRPSEELAAHAILFQVTGLCFMPAAAVGHAAATLVGQYMGARRRDLARRSAYSALTVGVLYMSVVGVALAVFRVPLIRAFNSTPEVIVLGGSIALIAAVYQPFDGFGIVVQGVLRGANQTAVPTAVMFASGLFVFIPLVWLLGERQGLGIRGAWMAALAHVIVVSALLALAVLRSKPCVRERRSTAPSHA